MEAPVPALAEQLLLIERELRLLGLWATTPPAAEALASGAPFCVDTLKFEEWLQWVFLPRMVAILENSRPLPATSGVRAMAEVVYRDRQPQFAGLLQALGRFDSLVSSTC